MGNEQPDLASLDAWIPKDGLTRNIIDNPRYPIKTCFDVDGMVDSESSMLTSEQQLKQPPSPSEKNRFDLIVLGMQEAADRVDCSGTCGPCTNSTDSSNETLPLLVAVRDAILPSAFYDATTMLEGLSSCEPSPLLRGPGPGACVAFDGAGPEGAWLLTCVRGPRAPKRSHI